MKMVFDKKELVVVKDVVETFGFMQREFLNALIDDEDYKIEAKEISVVDILLGIKTKFYSAKLGLNGELTIEIAPEFVVDFMNVYGKALKDVTPPAVALLKAMMNIQKGGIDLAEKWFDDEEHSEVK
jgi:hypothetical protein